jgi:acyl-CoA reductase-like NAD-dependent aldehyde dehydrogenase
MSICLFFKVGAAFGAAGQRCMALSTAVFVGDAQKWIPDLVDLAKKLVVNAGIYLALSSLRRTP